jgi:hypothetical protein
MIRRASLSAILALALSTGASAQTFGSGNATRLRGRGIDSTAPTNLQVLAWQCTIGATVFTGSGLNDTASGGTCTASLAALYTVEIDHAGSPDTFKWRKGAGSWTTGVSITGSAQALTDGVTITFKANTGHTLADVWSIATTVWWKPGTLSSLTGSVLGGANIGTTAGRMIIAQGTAATVTESTTHTTTTIPAATPVLGSIFYGSATPAWAALGGNTVATKKYLSQTGTGAVSAVPSWDQPASTELSDSAGLVRGAASLTNVGAIPRVSAAGTLGESTITDSGTVVTVASTLIVTEGQKIGFRWSAGSPGPYQYMTANGSTPLSFYNGYSSSSGAIAYSFFGTNSNYEVLRILNGGDISLRAGTVLGWPVGGVDIGIARPSAGLLEINTGTAGTLAPLNIAPGGTTPAWKKYALVSIANGVNGCTNANGCWRVNGVLGANKAAALTQDVVLFALPAKGQVTDWRIKTNTACTGATTINTGLGTTGSNVLFRAQTYSLTAVVSDTNLTNGPTAGTGSDTAAATNIVASLITTVANVDQIAAGCAVDFWVMWSVLP